jgi:hypothetical protein
LFRANLLRHSAPLFDCGLHPLSLRAKRGNPQKIKDQKLKIKMTDKNAKMFLFF